MRKGKIGKTPMTKKNSMQMKLYFRLHGYVYNLSSVQYISTMKGKEGRAIFLPCSQNLIESRTVALPKVGAQRRGPSLHHDRLFPRVCPSFSCSDIHTYSWIIHPQFYEKKIIRMCMHALFFSPFHAPVSLSNLSNTPPTSKRQMVNVGN